MPGFLLPDEPIESLDDYLAGGGTEALRRARTMGPDAVVAEVRASGLRGRGGGGFPTGIKWAGLAADPSPRKFLVANGAEGEPGTFKDRALLRANPYQLIEGIAVAALAVGAEAAYLATKAKFEPELAALQRALAEMSDGNAAGEVPITLVEGPDDYLFGEEKGLLEVIEGNDALPRLLPPYLQGLFGDGDTPNPAVVNNVETLSNVPHILTKGAEWFRSHGTDESPGTMVFSVSGDLDNATVAELEMGTPLSALIYGVGGGLAPGRSLKAAVSGVSNPPIPPRLAETPMSFEHMRSVGAGLGSGGFIVFDDSACIARVGEALSRFLATSSCGQCPPCTVGTDAIAQLFAALHSDPVPGTIDELAAWAIRVTDANRCGLGAGQKALAEGIIGEFWEELAGHLDGDCPSDREVELPLDLPLPSEDGD